MQTPGELVAYERSEDANGLMSSRCPVCARVVARSEFQCSLKLAEDFHLCLELRKLEQELAGRRKAA